MKESQKREDKIANWIINIIMIFSQKKNIVNLFLLLARLLKILEIFSANPVLDVKTEVGI